MELFVKLLLAHVLADFVLQPSSWVKHKEKHTWKSPYLYAHVGVYFMLTMLLLGFNTAYWWPAALVALSHYVIDLLKCTLNKRWQTKKQFWDGKKQFPLYSFVVDQALHISVLILWVGLNNGWNLHDFLPVTTGFWMLALCLLLLTQVSSIVIKMIVTRWIPEMPIPDGSLQNAGTYIGMLERLMVFVFVVTGHWEGIGFLIAAKSVLRYGDLKEAHDRSLSEYVLIGTLLSFGLALGIGLLYLQMIGS